MQRLSLAAAGFAVALAGCRAEPNAVEAEVEPVEVAATVSPPMDAGDEHDSIWSYLVARYDADGDGSVTPAEYGRASFDRLDKNGDGAIQAADFEAGARDNSEAMRRQRSQQLLAWYFQTDDDANKLPRTELEAAARTYDTSGDGKIDAEEFGCAAEERRELGKRPTRRATRELDAFATLLDQTDEDADGLLATAELVGFFDAMDDGDGVWNLGRGQRSSRGSGGPPSGPAAGTVAPDFTLSSPEGGAAVTLSSFAGEKPVGLIFGSYT